MPARASHRAPRFLLAAAALTMLGGVVAACGDVAVEPEATPVAGQGSVVTEARAVGDFTRVSIGAKVVVKAVEAAETRVAVEAQQNIVPLVTTTVTDGQLVVNIAQPGVSTTEPITVTISAPDIVAFSISSGADATLQASGEQLTLAANGPTALKVAGDATKASLALSAQAHADLADLKVLDGTVALTDGSSATMLVVNSVTGSVTGGATLTLLQQPASVKVESTTGALVQVASPAP